MTAETVTLDISNLTLDDIILEGRLDLDRRAAQEAAAGEAKRHAAEEELRQRNESLRAHVLAIVPAVLHPYIVMPDVADKYDRNPVRIEAPQCATVTMQIVRDRPGTGWKWDHRYYVREPQQVVQDYCGEDDTYWWRVEYTITAYPETELHIALAHASRLHTRQAQMEREAQLKNEQERIDREREIVERAAAKSVIVARDQAEKDEIETLCLLVQRDPLIGALVRVFTLVQAERARLSDQLESAGDQLAAIESEYLHRLESARADTQEAQRQADDLRHQAYAAEEKLEQLEHERSRW